jgi:hypothetical protein
MTEWVLPPAPDYWPSGIAPPLVVGQGRAVLAVLRQAGAYHRDMVNAGADHPDEQAAFQERRVILLGPQLVGYITDFFFEGTAMKMIPDGSIVRGALRISRDEVAHYSALLYAPTTPENLPFGLRNGSVREVSTRRLRELTAKARGIGGRSLVENI